MRFVAAAAVKDLRRRLADPVALVIWIGIPPAWMQSLALALPTGWTMDALHRLVHFGDPAAAALPHAAVLVATALALGWIGARVFRYQ